MRKVINIEDAADRIYATCSAIDRADSHTGGKSLGLGRSLDERILGMSGEIAAARMWGFSEERAFVDKCDEPDFGEIQIRTTPHLNIWVRPNPPSHDLSREIFVLVRKVGAFLYEPLGWEDGTTIRLTGYFGQAPEGKTPNARPPCWWLPALALRGFNSSVFQHAVHQYLSTIDVPKHV